MERVTVTIYGTRSHRYRKAIWQQLEPGIGVMEIMEGRTAIELKSAGKFLVTEHEPESGRRFQVQRENERGGGEYWVCIGRKSADDICDCDGFLAHLHCKHTAGIRALINQRKLIGRSDDPVTCFYTDEDS